MPRPSTFDESGIGDGDRRCATHQLKALTSKIKLDLIVHAAIVEASSSSNPNIS
jgi:hypothetical protein